jgi:hypothetical protein
MLYIMLARIGAKGDLTAIRDFPAYQVMGAVWILTRGGLSLLAAKRLRVPVFFAATVLSDKLYEDNPFSCAGTEMRYAGARTAQTIGTFVGNRRNVSVEAIGVSPIRQVRPQSPGPAQWLIRRISIWKFGRVIKRRR